MDSRSKNVGKEVAYRSTSSPYDKFWRSMHTDRTKESYGYALKDFLNFCKLKDYTDLLKYSDDERYNAIQDYIQYQVQDRKLSFNTVNISNCAIKLFFGVNGKEIRNWKELSRQKGKRKRVIKDRIYTLDEIKRLLEYADVREKVIILTLLSTGMRVTALTELRMKDVKPLTIEEKGYKIYRFQPYSEDQEDTYVTFCTPECAKAIDLYLDERRKNGETLEPDSPFITHKIDSRHVRRDKGFLHSKSIQKLLDRQRYEARIMSPTIMKDLKKKSKSNNDNSSNKQRLARKEVMRAHGFRKYFNTKCVENYIYPTVKEALMGHKTQIGLDGSYWRPTDENQLVQEYLKVVDALTISDENRLRLDKTNLEKRFEEVEELKRGSDQKDKQMLKLRQDNQDLKKRMKQAFDILLHMKQQIIQKDQKQAEKRKGVKGEAEDVLDIIRRKKMKK